MMHRCMSMHVPSLPDSGKFLLAESKIQESRKRLYESGIPLTIEIRNPSSTDKHMEAVRGIRNDRNTVWNWSDRCFLGFYLLLAWGALQTCSFFLFYLFIYFLLYVFVLPKTFTHTHDPRHLAILRGIRLKSRTFLFVARSTRGPKKAVLQLVVNRLGPVVRKVDNAIRWINLYPVDNAMGFPNTYRLDSDLSGGWRYPTFEQPEPELDNCRIWQQ